MSIIRQKFRIYPTLEQEVLLAKTFGCCRVVWNDALNHFNENGFKYGADKLVITAAKNTIEKEWLKEVSSVALQQSFRDLEATFKQYFNSLKGKRKGKKLGKPKFKSRRSRQSFRLSKSGFSIKNSELFLAKIGRVKMVLNQPFKAVPSSVTIIKESSGSYYASFVVEGGVFVPPIAKNESIAIDLGIKTFATLSNGEKIENPKFLNKKLRKVKNLQRKLSRTKKLSKRREVARIKLAKVHEKVKNARLDFQRKLALKLVRDNQAIVIEDLNVKGMMKNRKLSKSIADCAWGMFRIKLSEYCDKYQRQLIVVDRWFPSSRLCSVCGSKNTKLNLSDREWKCLDCGTVHDRDLNAATNLVNKWAEGHSDQDKNGLFSENKPSKAIAKTLSEKKGRKRQPPKA